MKKFCEGVGVFDTDNAIAHPMNAENARPHRVIYELHQGDTWVMSERTAGLYQMSKLSYSQAAYYFTRYGKDIPDTLARRV